MFEPIPNFGNSLPNRVVPLKTMRQLAMERAIPAMSQAPNPFLDDMLANPAQVEPMQPCEKQGERVFIFGLIKDKAPQLTTPKTRRVPQPYIFVGGKKVRTGPSKRWGDR